MMKALVASRWFALAELECAAVGGLLWGAWPQLAWLPLIVVLLPWAARLQAGRFPFRRTPLDGFVWLFLFTAAVGVWAAFDREVAWAKFWRIVGAVALYYALAGQPSANVRWTMGLLSASIAVLAGYIFVAHMAGLRRLDTHITGGVLAMFVPLFIVVLLEARQARRRGRMAVALGLGALTLAGFAFALKRGALLGLALAFGLWLWWRLSGQRRWRFLSGLALAAMGFGLVVWLFPEALIQFASPGRRLDAAGQSIWLAADFAFTGGGLGSFAGLYSRYIRGIPWLFQEHSYDLFINTLLDQGVLGLLALTGVVAGTAWIVGTRPHRAGHWRWAVWGGLIVLVVYGLVEDPFYSGGAIGLLFVFPGLAVAITEPAIGLARGARVKLAGAALVGLTALAAAWHIPWQAAWSANWGAVAMARVELNGWPEALPWQDDMARAEYAPATMAFERALQFSPDNVTAHYRVGLIAEKYGDDAEAMAHWEAAHRAAPTHRGVRKVLGYLYVWQNRLEDAAPLLSGIPEAKEELGTYAWWWGAQGNADRAARAAEMAQRLP